MGSLNGRLLRLEHDAGGRGPAADVVPLTDEERAERMAYWLSQDPATLSDFDQQRVDSIRYLYDRARRRRDSA